MQIGNWSRSLTEMFGMNSDDDEDSDGKAFVLLNELSDLLMLPKDMLMESSIREEVCYWFKPHYIHLVVSLIHCFFFTNRCVHQSLSHLSREYYATSLLMSSVQTMYLELS